MTRKIQYFGSKKTPGFIYRRARCIHEQMLENWRIVASNADKRPDRVKIHTYTVARKNAGSPGTILAWGRKWALISLENPAPQK